MTPFDDVLFPIEIGAEASVAPGFSTNIVTSASGYESRNANWAQARLRFDAGPGVRGDAELETLLGFFRARRGPAVGFRFRDPYDNSSSGMTGTPGAGGPDDRHRRRHNRPLRAGQDLWRRRGAADHAPGGGQRARRGRRASSKCSGWTLDDKGVVQFSMRAGQRERRYARASCSIRRCASPKTGSRSIARPSLPAKRRRCR